jgi:KUP system potassium uptake protein
VLSAISGLKVAVPAIQQGEVIGVTIVVLVLLFSVQYMGTAKISTVFAPIICIWLLFNAALGFANLSTYGWGVWQVRMLLCRVIPS